ncbi:hypothetical protein [uncultured Algibacter sp.]|uniref:hypothetical protein n=1 Tax=uncultured Algibacter sp. TaxID=298659 RepID=UPI0032178A36
MMELNSSISEFLHLLSQKPAYVVLGAAFGVPLFMFVYAMIIARIYKGAVFASVLNTIIFTTLGIVWIIGFILTIVLLFTGISGLKLFLIWLSLLVFITIFIIVNFTSVNKFLDEMIASSNKKREI